MSTRTDANNTIHFGQHYLHSAIHLNNEGVALLQQRKYACAMNTLNDSLRLIGVAVECSQRDGATSHGVVTSTTFHDDDTTGITTASLVGGGQPVDVYHLRMEPTPYSGPPVTYPVSIVSSLSNPTKSDVMGIDLITSVIFFNLGLAYASRAADATKRGRDDHQMSLRLSEIGWTILNARLSLATATHSEITTKTEPYLAMLKKILYQVIQLYKKLGVDETTLRTFHDLLACIAHRLTMIESIKDIEKHAAAGAA
jgi:hypothetical protein